MSAVHTIRRVFLAHPKEISDENLAEFTELAKKTFSAMRLRDGTLCAPDITTARDSVLAWQKLRVGKPFDWTAWQTHVTGSTKPWGGEPRFHYFLVGPALTVGRATAGLLLLAFRYQRTVLAFNDNSTALVKVASVAAFEPNNWKAGWRVITTG